MAKRLQNFELYAGDSKKIIFDVLDDLGANIDLTDKTFTWVVTKHRSLIAVITKTSSPAAGIAIVDGKVEVTLSNADTDVLDGIIYYHQAVMKDAAGNDTTVLTGYITVLRRKAG